MEVPVLLYHEVIERSKLDKNGRTSYAPNCITLEKFENHVEYLARNGYVTLSLDDILGIASGNGKFQSYNPKKVVAITFDDGYIGHYENVYRILIKHNFTATIFVIANRIGRQNYLSIDQMKEMEKDGIKIESHSLTHKPLGIMPEQAVKNELETSRCILEKNLNKSVKFISYPQGSYNNKVLELARTAGYAGSCITEASFFNTHSDIFKIKRIDIKPGYDVTYLEKILNKDSYFFFKLKFSSFIKNRIKRFIGTENYLKLYMKVFGVNDYIFSESKVP